MVGMLPSRGNVVVVSTELKMRLELLLTDKRRGKEPYPFFQGFSILVVLGFSGIFS